MAKRWADPDDGGVMVDVNRLRARLDGGETLERGELKKAKLRNADLSGLSLDGLDLSGCDLRGANLSRASLKDSLLQGAKCQGAQFQHANLQGVDLTRARLLKTDFAQADLTGATLPRVNLTTALLNGATFDNANLEEVDLSQVTVSDVSFRGANLHRCTLDGAKLDSARFDGARLTEVFIERVDLTHCVFEDADLSQASFARSQVKSCSFNRTNLSQTDLGESQLTDCSFEGAHLKGTILDRVTLNKINFKGADVDGADFQGVKGLSDDILADLESRGAVIHGINFGAFFERILKHTFFKKAVVGLGLGLLGFFFYYYMAPEKQPVDAVLDRAMELRQGGDHEGALGLYEALLLRHEGEDGLSQLLLLKAETLQKMERHEEAAAIFSSLAERPDQSIDEAVEAKLRLASVKADEGAFDEAIPILEAVTADADTASRDVARGLITLSSLYERMGFPEKAIAIANAARDGDSGRPEVILTVNRHIVNLLIHSGNYDDAEKLLLELEDYVHDDSSRAELLISQSRLYQAKGDKEKGLETMGVLLKEYPNNPELTPEVQMELAVLFARQQQLEPAEHILRDLLDNTELDSISNLAGITLATLFSDSGQHTKGLDVLESLAESRQLPKEDLGQLNLTQANLLTQVGREQEALTLLDELIENTALGQVGPSLLSKARILQDLEKHAEAELVLKDVLKRFAGVPDMASAAQMGLGQSYAALGRLDDAITLYNEMLEGVSDPDIQANIAQLLGQAQLAKGDHAAAAQTFQVLATEGNSPESQATGYFGLAEIAAKEGRTEDAESALRTIATSSQDPMLRAIALENLARAYQEAGNTSEAIVVLSEVIDTLPTGHDSVFNARMAIGHIYADAHAYEQALKQYHAAQKFSLSRDNQAQALLAEGALLSSQGLDKAAIQLYQTMLTTFEGRSDLVSEARLGLARSAEAEDDLESALLHYRRVAEETSQKSTQFEGSQGWSRILEALGRSDEAAKVLNTMVLDSDNGGDSNLNTQIISASATADSGDLEEAKKAFDALLAATTDDGLRLQILDAKAQSLGEAGDLKGAEAAYEQLITLAASSPDYKQNARMGLAGVQRAQHNIPAARSTYQRVVDESQEAGLRAWALESLAQLDLEAGDTEQAEQRYKSILSQFEDDDGVAHGARMGLAQLKRSRGETEDARELLRIVAKSSKDNGQRAWATLTIAQTFLDEEKHDQALDSLLEVIQDHPEEKEVRLAARLSLADLYRARGRLEEALNAYNAASIGQTFPEYRVNALLGSASTAQDLDQSKQAIDAYEKIIQRFGNSDEALFHAHHGIARLKLGEGQSETKEAIQSLNSLISGTQDPTLSAWALQTLGLAYLKIGDASGAKETYARLLDNPSNIPDLKKEAKDYLENN